MKAKVKIYGTWYPCEKVEFVRDPEGGVKKIVVRAITGPRARYVTDSNLDKVILE